MSPTTIQFISQSEELTVLLSEVEHKFDEKIIDELTLMIEVILGEKMEEFQTMTTSEISSLPKFGRFKGEKEDIYFSEWHYVCLEDEDISSFAKKDISKLSKVLFKKINSNEQYGDRHEKLAALLAFVSEVVFFCLSTSSLEAKQFRLFMQEL